MDPMFEIDVNSLSEGTQPVASHTNADGGTATVYDNEMTCAWDRDSCSYGNNFESNPSEG
ncbi:MAG: hypothetical protein MH252_01435 [Thermosynechococcaceae cyanobacterium MS004]|nr:hypothetical protein [Thermosynechococcaceae cyanobacterium MS004]